MNQGWDRFLFHFENLGMDYFFNAVNRNYNDNASGTMSFAVNNIEGVGEAIRISQMTHDWVGPLSNGWTPERNTLEHKIGVFLMAEKYGEVQTHFITTANEVRGLIINDRQSGQVMDALEGNGSTAFEWSDLRANEAGFDAWYKYYGVTRYAASEMQKMQMELMRIKIREAQK